MSRGVLGFVNVQQKSRNWSRIITAVNKLAVLIAQPCMICLL